MAKPKDESRIRAAQARANLQWEPEVKFYQSEWEKISKKLEKDVSPAEREKLKNDLQYAFDCRAYCQSKMV